MRIKRLEIQGFKSFADRASLAFGEGITGIVGPNGCGKSNVVDAIRWCMGEMSAKHLRGRAMQDVIFAGSDTRGPLGFAEVTLTFHNDGSVPPQYAPFTEIAVTRRLHRDGTSEYLVNKVPARLRDITDLFLGTGAGTRAYSIIEQGRIGFVVSARPEDRRSLIEEVAGITRFKARKKAAERRFEATEQNLLRVNDIVVELERQLGSLRRQARKAERYKELREELRDLDLHAATISWLELGTQDGVQQGERDRLDAAITDLQAALAAVEAKLEVERQRLADEERALMREQEGAAEIDARIAGLERDLTHWKAQLAESGERAVAARRDLEEARARLSYTELERVEAERASGDYDKACAEDRETIDGLAAAANDVQAALAAVDRELEERRKDALEHVHGAAQERAHAKNLERQRLEVRGRLESAEVEHHELLPRRQETQGRRGHLAADLERRRQELTALGERLVKVNAEAAHVTVEAQEGEQILRALHDELTRKASRLHSLEEIARRFEGYSDGVRTLLGARDEAGLAREGGKPVLPGIRALVSDVLTVTPAYERAIEAALGSRVQYLIVDSLEDGAAAVRFLEQSSGGQSGFVPMAPRLGERWTTMPVSDGVLGSARTFVTPQAGYEDIAEVLLGDVLIVADVPAALRLFAEGDSRLAGKVLVTKDGVVLDRGGVLTGGSVEGAGLLQKRREIRELKAEVENLEADHAARKKLQEGLEAERDRLEAEAVRLDRDLHAGELERVQLAKDGESLDRELARLDERLEVLGYELTQRREELAALDQDERAALDRATLAEAGQAEVETRLATLADSRRGRATELEERSAALTEARVQLASHEEKLAAARSTAQRLLDAHRDLAARIERDETTMAEGELLARELELKLERGRAELSEAVALAQSRHTGLSTARGRYETDRAALSGVEHELREQRRSLESMQQALLASRMELQRLALERQRLVDHVAERYDLALTEVVTDYHLRPPPGPEAQERRAELDRAIRAMGPINLTAIEECSEIEQRHAFLVRQRDDLTAALDALKKAIQRINRQSRERFREAFEAVNEMFQQVFPRLFRGGEARLDLVESEDLLEAGVDIVAQPPGKKLQNVTLLSGGEKALTATALVFAIFLVKPSPFCVLDEVDAPLDEANVGRFNDMLREISKLSQFILITHNKNTMSESDRLYGITMEEPGMSKVVAVDLKRSESAAVA
jgi:chromosome segregation protein